MFSVICRPAVAVFKCSDVERQLYIHTYIYIILMTVDNTEGPGKFILRKVEKMNSAFTSSQYEDSKIARHVSLIIHL